MIACTCGHQSPDLESFAEHRHDAHGDGTAYAVCCNCGKRRRKAEMLHWGNAVFECIWCNGEIYLDKQRAVGQRSAAYARSCLPTRQPVAPVPIPAPTGRFVEAWED